MALEWIGLRCRAAQLTHAAHSMLQPPVERNLDWNHINVRTCVYHKQAWVAMQLFGQVGAANAQGSCMRLAIILATTLVAFL